MRKRITVYLHQHRKLRAFILRFWVIVAVFTVIAIILVVTGQYVGFVWALEKVGEAIADSGAEGIAENAGEDAL